MTSERSASCNPTSEVQVDDLNPLKTLELYTSKEFTSFSLFVVMSYVYSLFWADALHSTEIPTDAAFVIASIGGIIIATYVTVVARKQADSPTCLNPTVPVTPPQLSDWFLAGAIFFFWLVKRVLEDFLDYSSSHPFKLLLLGLLPYFLSVALSESRVHRDAHESALSPIRSGKCDERVINHYLYPAVILILALRIVPNEIENKNLQRLLIFLSIVFVFVAFFFFYVNNYTEQIRDKIVPIAHIVAAAAAAAALIGVFIWRNKAKLPALPKTTKTTKTMRIVPVNEPRASGTLNNPTEFVATTPKRWRPWSK
tara:strand:+ start:2518 stop:3453 length:936 start_codon:yes stop_codon:yes gene_type:complete